MIQTYTPFMTREPENTIPIMTEITLTFGDH